MKLILLDPGHGGRDTGTRDSELVESWWVLNFAKMLATELDPTCLVALTRHSDRNLTLTQRGAIARRLQPDLVVSLHVNAFDDPKVRGMIVFCNSADLKPKASLIQQDGPAALQRKKNGVFVVNSLEGADKWPRVHNVLKQYGSTPAMLIECGFRTNEADKRALLGGGQFHLLDAIAKALNT